ncbi:hypothetical protein ACLIA0_06225 [Bacillaceae bacterium W0354]
MITITNISRDFKISQIRTDGHMVQEMAEGNPEVFIVDYVIYIENQFTTCQTTIQKPDQNLSFEEAEQIIINRLEIALKEGAF